MVLLFFQAEDGIRDIGVTGVQTCALPICAALLALSLGRAVLVPDNDVTRDLAAEVGERWVRRFSAPLTPELLVGAASDLPSRSEERRVGKERRSRWSPYH